MAQSVDNPASPGSLEPWTLLAPATLEPAFALHVAARAQGRGKLCRRKLLQEIIVREQSSEQTISRMLYDILFPIFKLGLDTGWSGSREAHRAGKHKQHVALSPHIIEESMVLLKNGLACCRSLPGMKSIAIIGAAAGPGAITGEEGPAVFAEKSSVPAEALEARAGSAMKVTYHNVGVASGVATSRWGCSQPFLPAWFMGSMAAYYRSPDRERITGGDAGGREHRYSRSAGARIRSRGFCVWTTGVVVVRALDRNAHSGLQRRLEVFARWGGNSKPEDRWKNRGSLTRGKLPINRIRQRAPDGRHTRKAELRTEPTMWALGARFIGPGMLPIRRK